MIRRIRLHNVGVFENAAVPNNLKHIVLVYAENASGKTTFAEVLRSLETGDPSIILKRSKFDTNNNPHITIECDGDPPKVVFKDGVWGEKRPTVKVFDEAFVDSNVYSGLEVGSEHRKGMYYLALGEEGVRLSRIREKLGRDIMQYTKDMREAKEPISGDQRSGLSMDEFCNIQEVPDIETEIEKARMDLDAIQDADTILNTPQFDRISLPAFDKSGIHTILQRGLQDLDAEAAARVAKHVESLGNRGESWIAEGMGYVSDDAKACPFCGQKTSDASLIRHYRAYFSEAYSNLKRDIEGVLNGIRSTHSGDAQITFVRTVGTNRDTGHVWAKYGLKPPNIDTKAIIDNWTSALNAVVKVLEAKQAAPLERIKWDNNEIESHESNLRLIEVANIMLDGYNDEIEKKKKMVNATNLRSIERNIHLLEVTKERYSPTTATLCDRYIQAKNAKAKANEEKIQVTNRLESYRNKAFFELQDGVNHYLQKFGARFTMDNFTPKNTTSGSSCSYSVVVGNTPIGATKSKSDYGATIGSTLSTSDRNMLALALFLSSLERIKNLADSTVVIDDPVSSTDDNRTKTTVQELRELAGKVGQMIILSHKKSFLGDILRKIAKERYQSLVITYKGNGSVIDSCDISQEFNADQAKQQRLLEAYVNYEIDDRQEVFKTIRPYLEAALEILCAAHYKAGKSLGVFLSECKGKCGTTNEILDEDTIAELYNIFEYANPAHHGSHIDPENPDINGNELRTYAKRALDITKLSVGK